MERQWRSRAATRPPPQRRSNPAPSAKCKSQPQGAGFCINTIELSILLQKFLCLLIQLDRA